MFIRHIYTESLIVEMSENFCLMRNSSLLSEIKNVGNIWCPKYIKVGNF